MSGKSRYNIDILDVTFDLIECLANKGGKPQKASSLAKELDVSHNRVFRILKTLESRCYVESSSRADGYQLSLGFVAIGEQVRERISLRQEAAPILAELAEKTGDATCLLVRHGLHAMIIERYVGHHSVQVTASIGELIPLHLGASPKLLLAFLPEEERNQILGQLELVPRTNHSITDRERLVQRLEEIRGRGYEVEEGEMAVGAVAIAAPVRDHTAEVVAGISLTTPDPRYNAPRRDRLIKLLVNAAKALSIQLGYTGPSEKSVQPVTARLFWQPRRRPLSEGSRLTALGLPVQSDEQRQQFEIEAKSIVEAAREQGLTLRLLGALAFRLQCLRYSYLQPSLGRSCSDINIAGYRKEASQVRTFFLSLGYCEDAEVNLLYSGQRMIFYHPIIPGLYVDVFFDMLDFCHQIRWQDRLEVDPLTLPFAELLMEKLQIVEVNEKDIIDTIMFLLEQPLGDHDERTINTELISHLCAQDWGMWRTFTMNLEKVKQMAETYHQLTDQEKARVAAQVNSILTQIDQKPKSTAWKLRARIGDRVKWYQEVDDII